MPQGSGNFGKRNTNGEGGSPRVIDFNQVRTQKLDEKRRTTERIFFKHLLNVYSVVNTDQMLPIEFIDVSDEGCSFQIPHDPEKVWPTTTNDIPLRIYF